MPEGAYLTTDKVVIANITPGVLAKINFGVKLPEGVDLLEAPFQIIRDRGIPKPRLNVAFYLLDEGRGMPAGKAGTKDEGRERKYEFRIFTNYQLFIEKWELEIFDKDTMHVIKTFRGTKTDILDPVYWNGRDKNGRLIMSNRNYAYRLTVTGLDGRHDVTIERAIELQITNDLEGESSTPYGAGKLQKNSNNQKTSDNIAEEHRKWIEEESKINNLEKQTIKVAGETVKIRSQQFAADSFSIIKAGEVRINVPVLESGKLRAKDLPGRGVKAAKDTGQGDIEIIMPGGEYEIEMSVDTGDNDGRGTEDGGRRTKDVG